VVRGRCGRSTRDPGRRSSCRTSAVEAHELYTRARLQIDRFGKGSLQEARALLERAIGIDPRHVDALGALASTCALQSIATTNTADIEHAIAFADRALAVDPDHVKAYVWKGYALMRLERIAEAEAALRRAVDLDPRDSDAHYFAAAVPLFYNSARRVEAVSLLQRAVELAPGHGMWWLALGSAHLALERRTEANRSYNLSEGGRGKARRGGQGLRTEIPSTAIPANRSYNLCRRRASGRP
jgi:tetratricopeptide (TPR) repeat protein